MANFRKLIAEPSDQSFHTVDMNPDGRHGRGDEMSPSKHRHKQNEDELLGTEWDKIKVNGTRVAFSYGKPAKKLEPKTTQGFVTVAGPRVPPFTCSLCLGPVIEATVPLCGHSMFCRNCIEVCKKHFNACPVCGGSLGDLVRVYEVDMVMDEYFAHDASSDDILRYAVAKQKRLAELLEAAEAQKTSYRKALVRKLELICVRFRTKGVGAGLGAVVSQMCCRARSISSTKIQGHFCTGIVMGIVIGLIIVLFGGSTSPGTRLVNFCWSHIVDGFCKFSTPCAQTAGAPPPPPPPASFDLWGWLRCLIPIPGWIKSWF